MLQLHYSCAETRKIQSNVLTWLDWMGKCVCVIGFCDFAVREVYGLFVGVSPDCFLGLTALVTVLLQMSFL